MPGRSEVEASERARRHHPLGIAFVPSSFGLEGNIYLPNKGDLVEKAPRSKVALVGFQFFPVNVLFFPVVS